MSIVRVCDSYYMYYMHRAPSDLLYTAVRDKLSVR